MYKDFRLCNSRWQHLVRSMLMKKQGLDVAVQTMKTPQQTLDPSNNSHSTNRPAVNTKLRYEFLTTVTGDRCGGGEGRYSPCLANDGECRGYSSERGGGGKVLPRRQAQSIVLAPWQDGGCCVPARVRACVSGIDRAATLGVCCREQWRRRRRLNNVFYPPRGMQKVPRKASPFWSSRLRFSGCLLFVSLCLNNLLHLWRSITITWE